MDVRIGDVLQMKKPHPCSCNMFNVLRVGMDFRLECQKCGHKFMIPRAKAEKNIKNIIRNEDTEKVE